jgi:PIN domain nuclease of toxin-antitoxin system
VWEIATKVRLGKLPEAQEIETDLVSVIEQEAGYTLITIDAASALRAARFNSPHRDPFDRMLAAQALVEDIPIVSADPKLDSFGVQRIW